MVEFSPKFKFQVLNKKNKSSSRTWLTLPKYLNKMKKIDAKRLMKVGKSKTLPIIDKTAYVRNGWATSTDLKITISVKTDIKGEGVINLENIVKTNYDSAEIRNGFLYLKKGTAESKFPVYPETDFPRVLQIENEKLKIGSFSSNDILAIKSVSKHCGDDDLRPAMMGVYFDEKYFVATDASTLTWLPNKTKLSGVIIPKKVIDLIPALDCNAYRNGDEGHNITITSSDEAITFTVIEGRYPNYQSVIPETNPIKVKVNTAKLIAALNNALPSANRSTFQAVLSFTKNELTVQSYDDDYSTEYSETIPIKYTGDENLNIGFSIKFMQKCLDKSISETKLEMSDAKHCCIINENTLLMPSSIICKVIKEEETTEAEATEETSISETENMVENSTETEIEDAVYDEEITPEEITPEEEAEATNEEVVNDFPDFDEVDQLPAPPEEVYIEIEADEVEAIENFALQNAYKIEENGYSHLKKMSLFELNELVADMEANEELYNDKFDDPVYIYAVTTDRIEQVQQSQTNEKEADEVVTPEEVIIEEVADEVETENESTIFLIKNYTEKSFIVFGDVAAIADKLIENRGKFTRNMKVAGIRLDAYWFSNKRLEAVEAIIDNA